MRSLLWRWALALLIGSGWALAAPRFLTGEGPRADLVPRGAP
jgi:hypothetical protein